MSNQSKRLLSFFGAAASALGRRYRPSSPRSRLIIRQVALCTGGGLVAATAWASVASAATTEFMAEPISGIDSLKSNDMKARMESLIMQVQTDFCRALEKEEEENSLDEEPKKFKARIVYETLSFFNLLLFSPN
jgi:coproporphyrinogen III oxidase